MDNRRVFLISLIQNAIRFFRMKTPKMGKFRLSQAISRTWHLTSRGSDFTLTWFESVLFINGAPKILSRSCSSEIQISPGHQDVWPTSLCLEQGKNFANTELPSFMNPPCSISMPELTVSIVTLSWGLFNPRLLSRAVIY